MVLLVQFHQIYNLKDNYQFHNKAIVKELEDECAI